jgi:hypothetical protein
LIVADYRVAVRRAFALSAEAVPDDVVAHGTEKHPSRCVKEITFLVYTAVREFTVSTM